jgi:hypothetical protein
MKFNSSTNKYIKKKQEEIFNKIYSEEEEDKQFIITQTQINEINYYLNNRAFHSIRSILKQLQLYSPCETELNKIKEIKNDISRS